MNKIFKIIWSKARNCYVVVSELAKSHDDGHVCRSRSGCCRKAAVLAAFVLTTSLAVVPVWAADSNGNINNVVTIKDNQPDRSAMDGNNNLNGTNNVVYGTGNTADKSGAVIVGKNSKGDKESVVIGNGAQSNAEDQIIIGKGTANGSAVGSIVIGNSEAIANTSQSVIIGNNTKANGSGQGVIVMGNGAMADDSAAGYTDNGGTYIPAGIVLGEYSYSNTRAGKEGFLSNKKGDKPSPAFTDEYWNAVWKATANPMAIGNADTDANGKGEGHNGHGVLTRQITGVAAGTDLTDAVNVAQLQAAMAQFSGGGSGTSGDGVHYYSVRSDEQGPDSNYDNKGAKGKNSLAAGVNASAKGENAVAIGNGATADGVGATVIGQYGTATGRYALAFGGQQTDTSAKAANNVASGDNAVAFGERTTASGSNSTAFGQETKAAEKRATAFGQRTQAIQSNATAFGIDTIASGQNATAFGNLTQATEIGATAFGNKNQATGQYATAWGGGDKVVDNGDGTTTKVGTVASGTYATAFGERTVASGESATAFGSDSTASGKNAAAFGASSTAAGENSLAALGGTTAKDAVNAAAIGNGAQAKLADTVALGSGSVADRQSGVKGYDAAIGAETTQKSATWISNANAIAVGNGTTLTRQITGVAAGSQDTDAVNLAQLKEVGKLAGKHTTVSVGGNKTTADDTLVTGGNLELKRQTTGGQANYDVALSKDVILGEQVENKGGSLVVNSVAQFRKAPDSKETYPVKEAVKIDGTTISVVKNDGTNDQRQVVLGVGQDTGGYVALFDKTGNMPTYIFNAISPGITYLKDSKTYPADEANEFKRLEYGDITNGSTQFIATLDDGLKFSGDQGTTSAVKLNQKLSVTGGETNKDNLVTANNIGVVSSQDGENGKLELKLNKDLTGLNTVTAGTAKIGHNADGVLDTVQNGQPTGGHAAEGDYVTGLTNKEWTVKDPTYVSGRAATEDELRIVSDEVSGNTTKITNNATQITNNTNAIAKGLSFTTNTKDASNTGENYKGYKVVKRNLGDTIAIKASDEADNHSYSTANLTTRIAENGDISILMDEKPTFTTVTTGDVIYTGNPDKKDNEGKAAQADTSVHYGDKTLTDGKNITTSDNETKATRLHYKDDQDHTYELATMDDGQIYAGDIKTDGTLDSNGFARTMNQKTTINGGMKSKDSLTDGNIGVVSNGTDTLTVKLAKELKDLTSVTTGKTVQNDSGITITNDKTDETKNVVINGDKISFGGNQVTNMGSGINKVTNQYDITTNGANIGDVKNIANSTTEVAKLTGDSNITVTYNDHTAGGKNTVKLNDSITLGSDAGKKVTIDGTKGTITAGDKVSFDGSNGKGSIGGVTIGNQTGVATTKKDGDKAKTEDGTFVTGLTNTTWNPDANGIVSGRAATEDQLKTVSDTVNAGWELDVNSSKQKDVTPASRKVNFVQGQNITITGSGDDVTVATADDVRFASVRVGGDADGNGGYTGGIVIGKQSGGASANPDENDYITGLKNINWDATKIQSGRAATEDQLKKVAEDIKQGTVSGDVYVTGGEVTYHTDGGTDNGQPTVNDGTGKLTLTENNKTTTVDITGLHDYYATSGTVSEDGKKLTIARNERDKDGNPVTFDVDLTNLLNKEKHLIANPAADSNGVYKVNEQGEVTLQVQDAAGNNTPVTISGFEGVVDHYKGLNFDANSRKTTDGKAYNVKMGGTIKVQGIDPVSGHDYSADNVTTEVDANGNITIKLDKALTADTVMVNGKDGKDGQIGLNGKDGKDGTVTTIIRTIGKNGTDGKNGTAGVNGTDGITRIVYQDGKDGEPGTTTTTHTVATLDDGLKFGANAPATGKTDNPVGNKLNSTINIKGAGTKTLDRYSGQNLITSVEQDADGNTTINVLMDKALTADTVMVNGKDGKDGQIGLNGKNGTDGTVTTIIRTVGKNGTNGTDGKPGVNGTDGITRIIYQDGKDGESGTTTHTVATLDDGLKFAGDDGQNDTTKVIRKKLNEQLDIVGKATGELTDNNIGVKNADGKLYVRLAKHVDLDADGTLKAGDATIGAFSNTQLTTNKNNHAPEGSYATGLSNKDWSVADPEYVSGRAATEDQLAKLSQSITDSNTVRTDYQLVQNPDTVDGSYTATNGELTLKVRDTEHTNDPKYPDKTITIKDIASKTKVDEAYDRTVKYDMKDGKVDKTHVTFEAADEAGNPLDTQVSHMASGASEITDDGKGNKTYTYNTENNAANIGDVKRLAAESSLHYSGDTGTGTSQLKDTVAFNGTEGQIVTAAENGKVTFKLADDLTTRTITVTGKDGKDGISVKGKDGKDGVTITGKDGVDGVDGAEGHIGLNGKDGMVDIWTKPGKPGVDGKDGETTMTRIVYKDPDGKEHQGATLDDGLKFHGDSGDIVTRKLNTQLDVLGGQTDTTKLTDGNIGVVSTQAADETSNGKLEIRLAKELKNLTSVTTGKTVQDDSGIKITNDANDETKNVVLNGDKVSFGGNQVNNMGSGLGNTYTTDGDNNGANIGDVKKLADSRKTTVKSTDGSVSVVDKNADNPNATSHDYDLSVDTSKVAEGVTLKYKGDNNTQGSNKLSEAVTFSGTANQIVTTAEDSKVTFKLADDLTTRTITVTGKDGKDGQIGISGKDGADGKVTTIIKTIGKNGADGKPGTPGVNGTDGITRIIYQDGKDGEAGTTTHTMATLDDGLKFHGDSGDVVTRKLNTQLDVLGGQTDTTKLTATTDGNIGVVSTKAADETSNGKLEIRLAKELKNLTSVTTGKTVQDDSGIKITNDANDETKNVVLNGDKVSFGGNQVNNMGSGLGNTYTTDGDNNGANIGDVKKLADSRKTTVKSTDGSVSVVDKNANDPDATSHDYDLSVDTSKVAGAVDLKYKGDNNTQGSNKLSDAVTFSGTKGQIVTKAENGKVTFSLADDVITQTITANGKNGNDGQIGLTGKDGADGKVTTIIKTVGAKGTDGKDGIPGVDGQPGKDGITRLMYEEKGGTEHHVVATLDDGLKFVGNDGNVVTRRLNDTLSIKGGIDDAAVLADKSRVSIRNLGVRQNTAGDGLEIVMTNRPDFEAITVGPDGGDPAHKITIGQQDNQADNPNPAKGNYIKGLDNTQWDAGNVVADRAATEGQLSQAITDISGKDKGGFGLADEAGGTVKKDLGQTVTVKGDGKNIETKVNGDALEVSLKKDVVLGDDGSLKAGNTTINGDGVETNKVKVGDINITDQGINGGAKQITNIASGIDGKQYATVGDNNAASIGDVKKIAGEEAGKAAEAVKSKSGKNITVKDDHTVNLNDNITLGDETDASKQVSIDGNGAKVTAGDGANQVTVDGSKGQVNIGSGDNAMTLGKQANTAGDSNPANGNFLNGLENTKWDGKNIQSGRAATEDQLKTVSDKVNSGRVFQGDDGKEVKVGMGDALKIQGGVKAEDVSQENNIGIVKGADDTLNIRLAKDLKGLDSVTTGNTTINNSGLTVKGDDNHKDITIHQDNVNMGSNKVSGVADGKVSKDSTDAVNGSQLWQRDQAINGLSGSVNKLGNRINRVGAGAAALAALHPLDFDPDDKWDFAAGYGNYRGVNAAAIGAYYRPNEDTMFSVGGSFGGGENMVNAGVSIKLGQGNHVSTSRVAMAKEMKAMRQHMAEQDALIAKLQSMHGMAVDPAKSVLFPDVAENHWAYQYVTTLAKKGILEGYPDGEFKGDRMMTRYEFAAIVYRIVESGVGSTDPELSKLVKEFSPELQYIRIDTIQKDRNGKPTIERVRVISDAK